MNRCTIKTQCNRHDDRGVWRTLGFIICAASAVPVLLGVMYMVGEAAGWWS